MKSRSVPTEEAERWAQRLEELEEDVDAVLKEEKEEKAMATAEREVKRGENLVVHEKEILARPKRTWFESGKEKREGVERGRRELNGVRKGDVGGIEKAVEEKAKKGKLSGKEKKKLDLRDEREAKRSWKKGTGERLGGGGGGSKAARSKMGGKMKAKRRGGSSKKGR